MINNQYTVNDVLHDVLLQKKCAEYYIHQYPTINLVVDACVCITNNSENYYKDDIGLWNILLITRKNEPWKSKLALPGGFVNYDETILNAVRRELFEETGLLVPSQKFSLSGYYDKLDRDPRGRVVSFSFSAYLCLDVLPKIKGNDDASDANFYNLKEILFDKHDELAADHLTLIRDSWNNFIDYP